MNREWKVLIVDYDLNHLLRLEKMLQSNHFKVTKCQYAKEAISMLQEDRNRFDVVITDLNMPDMDGFELLKCIGLDMDIPVLMTSTTDDDEDLIRKGLIHGACDFLIKPIQMENVKHLWKYAYWKQRHQRVEQPTRSTSSSSRIDNDLNESNTWENHFQKININSLKIDSIVASSDGEDDEKCMKKRKHASNLGDLLVNDDATTKKKQRVIWTTELHAKFVEAINQIGSAKVVPKKILEIMNIPGLTRENVASHLQKHRLYHKKFEQISQHQNEGKTFISPIDVYNVQAQVLPNSSSFQVRDFTSMNSHPRNLRLHHHVENGGNVIYHPVVSYAYCSTKVHLVENAYSLKNNVISEEGLDTCNTGETTSIEEQANNTYESYVQDLCYNDTTFNFD